MPARTGARRALLGRRGAPTVYVQPSETVGSELITNGDMAAATGWTVGANWSIAGGVATSSSSSSTDIRQTVLPAVGSYVQVREDVTRSAGTLQPFLGSTLLQNINSSTPRTYRHLNRVAGNQIMSWNGSGGYSGTVDNASAKQISPGTAFTTNANVRVEQYYTLPASPEAGTQIWVMPRISDFASGNYWLALLEYTGTQWNVTLYSVAAHTRTARIATQTNIGTTNGIAINCNGDTISLYTTANGGANWTQQGSTISNSLYNTATGANAMWTDDVTIGNMAFANPT